MTKGRLEAFSDGVVAILITIMVLELRAPHGSDWAALKPVIPGLLTYVLSFVFLGIYWNNHHHMLHAAVHINGKVLWANQHLLFWLSLVPFVTGWMDENHFAPVPVAAYGVVLFLAAMAYWLLKNTLIEAQGTGSKLAAALGDDVKGKISPLLYLVAIAAASIDRRISLAIYALVALMWLVPDPRIESKLARRGETHEAEQSRKDV